jgi:hypothetical protein
MRLETMASTSMPIGSAKAGECGLVFDRCVLTGTVCEEHGQLLRREVSFVSEVKIFQVCSEQ